MLDQVELESVIYEGSVMGGLEILLVFHKVFNGQKQYIVSVAPLGIVGRPLRRELRFLSKLCWIWEGNRVFFLRFADRALLVVYLIAVCTSFRTGTGLPIFEL